MSRDPITHSRRNAALRLAFAITVGLTFESARGAVLPTLAPIIALQLLAGFPKPPGLKLLVMLVAVTGGASAAAYAVSLLTVDSPLGYAIGVGLLYLFGFALAFLPRTAPVGVMVVTMTVVVTGLATASTVLALGIMVSLVQSVLIGFVLVLASHAVLPSMHRPTHRDAEAGTANNRIDRLPPALRALLATTVLLPAHLYLFAHGIGSILVLMTIATMLRQPGLDASTRYSLSFAAGNFIGAAVAAGAMLLVTTHGSSAVMVSVTAAASLLLAWMSALGPVWRAVMIPGMVAFVVLYGLVFSPYVAGTDVSITGRAAMVVTGALYAVAAVSLLVPLIPRVRRFLWPSGAAA